jgi:hypothetical protein
MRSPFIHGRLALADAAELIDVYGDDAGFEAAVRAERSRDEGNVARFCHWRQIEREIATLSSDESTDPIHKVIDSAWRGRRAERLVQTGAIQD